jgi:hypothetical protein
MAMVVVDVKEVCAWAVAVTVTLLLVGRAAGAVYVAVVQLVALPLQAIAPVAVPLIEKVASVLLRFNTVAVHCDVPSKVTLVGVQETEMVGVVVVDDDVLPQELRIAGTAISAMKKKRRSQRTLARLKWKFGSNTRNPPARTTLIILRNIRSLYFGEFHKLRQGMQVGLAFVQWIENRTARAKGTLPSAVRKFHTSAGKCPAPETVFSRCR